MENKIAAKVYLGEEGLKRTWQEPFTKTEKCVHCKGEARIAFVMCESGEGKCVWELHENDPDHKGYWVHDACAVAVYFCKDCFKVTAIKNQG
jgi:hypothetical protein